MTDHPYGWGCCPCCARVSAGGDTPARIAVLEAELAETRKEAKQGYLNISESMDALVARAEKAEVEVERLSLLVQKPRENAVRCGCTGPYHTCGATQGA